MEIKEKEFCEVLNYSSKNLVGKILKRFEIIENKSVLKANVKELIYEEYRALRDLLFSVGKGFSFTTYKFNNGENSK